MSEQTDELRSRVTPLRVHSRRRRPCPRREIAEDTGGGRDLFCLLRLCSLARAPGYGSVSTVVVGCAC